jgi:hypothetical protein
VGTETYSERDYRFLENYLKYKCGHSHFWYNTSLIEDVAAYGKIFRKLFCACTGPFHTSVRRRRRGGGGSSSSRNPLNLSLTSRMTTYLTDAFIKYFYRLKNIHKD